METTIIGTDYLKPGDVVRRVGVSVTYPWRTVIALNPTPIPGFTYIRLSNRHRVAVADTDRWEVRVVNWAGDGPEPELNDWVGESNG